MLLLLDDGLAVQFGVEQFVHVPDSDSPLPHPCGVGQVRSEFDVLQAVDLQTHEWHVVTGELLHAVDVGVLSYLANGRSDLNED